MGGNACTSLHHHLAERLGQRIRTGVDAVQAFITELRVADPRRRRHQVAHVHLAVVAEDHAVAVDHEHAAVGLQLAEDLAGPCVGVVDPVQHRPVRVLQEVQRGVGTNVEGLPVQDRLVCGLFDADLHAAIGALRLDGLAGVGPAPRQRVLIHLQAVLAQPVCDHESRVTPRLPGFLLQPLLQRDGLHLELTRTGREGEETFNQFALMAAGQRGLPVVASNDVRFLSPSDFSAHEARVCISTGRVLDDPKRPREYSDQQYLKSAEEMCALFADIPDAIDNTLALAERCNIEMRLGTYFLPNYPVPDDETLDTWIQKMSRDGLEERLEKNPLAPGKTREEYFERLEFELNTIIKMGFPGYFLIVADFIQWGKNQGIPIGPGRGSGAGSLVAAS
ncbi:hypothetical protein G6F24_013267 [Rhizopus arrhizus]|nr:hypothetical protein G6F24_013267 [Rhizopus arrhizus]